MPTATPNAMTGAYVQLKLDGTVVANGFSSDYGESAGGDWQGVIGSIHPMRDPNFTTGHCTIQGARIFGNSLADILKASGKVTAAQISSGDVDWSTIPFDATVTYNDGTKTVAETLTECYVTSNMRNISGQRLIRRTVEFDYNYTATN